MRGLTRTSSISFGRTMTVCWGKAVEANSRRRSTDRRKERISQILYRESREWRLRDAVEGDLLEGGDTLEAPVARPARKCAAGETVARVADAGEDVAYSLAADSAHRERPEIDRRIERYRRAPKHDPGAIRPHPFDLDLGSAREACCHDRHVSQRLRPAEVDCEVHAGVGRLPQGPARGDA